MFFNKLTGSGAQEILFIKRAIEKIKSLLNNKQDKFANIGEDESLNKVLIPAGEYDVILNDDFKASSSSTDADSNNIVNVSMLRGYHDSAKQDKLTAGANVNISEENVISSTGGETWHDIISYEIPSGETSINSVVIDEDLNGNPINLKKAKIYIFAPPNPDWGGTKVASLVIKDNNNNLHSYGLFDVARNDVNNYSFIEFECFSSETAAFAKFTSLAISVTPQPERVSFGTTSDSAMPFASAKELKIMVENNYFLPVGTKFVIKGVDA